MTDGLRMNRRSFLGAMLAAAAAPAFVRASSLMPIRVIEAPRVALTSDGWYREVTCYDINRDALVTRLDTFDGVEKFWVDFVAPPRLAGRPVYERSKANALAVLRNHVEHHSIRPFDLRAPPMPEGVLHVPAQYWN